MAGSAIFGIIFASVTVWSALFTYLLLSKPQTKLQTAGIAAVVCGLALPALERSGSNAQDEWGMHIGIGLTSVGTLFYSIEYVLCERIYQLYDRPVDARQLCFYTGAWGLGFTAVWVGSYTLPRWDELVVREVALAGGSPYLLLLLYASHMLNNSAHNWAWFVVCELEGGVSTGLLMGLKAAALFFFSALFFCSDDHLEQCLTATKLGGTIIVIGGTAVYYGGCSAPLWCFCFPPRSRQGRVRLRDDRPADLEAEIVGELSLALDKPFTPSELEVSQIPPGRATCGRELARGGGGGARKGADLG
jgi:drug/metabolite transporter (DMT)-like permease